MNKLTPFLVMIIIALGFILGTTMQSKAANKGFMGVIPFVTSNNRVGFFDQGTGKIYMYDDNITTCLFVGQLTELGQSIQTLANNTPPGTNNIQ
jgi:hypothetical protein